MPDVVLAAEAVEELREARGWYDERTPGAGSRLVDRVDEKLGAIARSPTSFPRETWHPILRRALVRGFPYALIFMVHGDRVVVLAVAHVRRRPKYWKARLRARTAR